MATFATHDLAPLFEKSKEICNKGDRRLPILLQPLEATIKEMAAIDATVQTFRYNTDRRRNCTCKVLVTTIGYAVRLPCRSSENDIVQFKAPPQARMLPWRKRRSSTLICTFPLPRPPLSQLVPRMPVA
jgi:hypothetical protein